MLSRATEAVLSDALVAHGYQRATAYIDLVVPATAEVGLRFKEALTVLPTGSQTMRDKDASDRFIIERALAMSRSPSESDKSDQ